MDRRLIPVLLGAALLVPGDADAQRSGERRDDDRPRVQKLAPVRTSGRVVPRARPARVRPYTSRSRVVYSSHVGYGAPRAYRPYRDARVRVRLSWGRSPVRFHARAYRDRLLSPGELKRVLGAHTVSRIRVAGRRAGLRGAPRGQWIDTRRHGIVLVVTMERTDVAEFIDYDRDGLFEDAFLFGRDAGRRWAGVR